MKGESNQFYVFFLEKFLEVRRGYLDIKLVVLIAKRCNRLEPGFVLALAEIVAENRKTFLPQFYVFLVHLHVLSIARQMLFSTAMQNWAFFSYTKNAFLFAFYNVIITTLFYSELRNQ